MIGICIGNATDDWTIDLWVKLNSTSKQDILNQWSGEDEYYHVYYSGDKFHFSNSSISGGWHQDIILDSSSNYTDTNWHHVVVVKNGANWGLYIDGIQEAYDGTLTHTHTYSTGIEIGRRGYYDDHYFNGHIDGIRIQRSNIFNAAPNSGKTDTITVLTSEHIVGEGSTFYMPTGGTNLNLVSDIFTAEAQPTKMRIMVLEEDVDSVTVGTDLKAYVSRDGSTLDEVTLTDEGEYEDGKRILSGEISNFNSSGTDMLYKIEGVNTKNFKIHGVGLSWE